MWGMAIGLVMFVVGIAVRIFLLIRKNSIIIYYGIKSYRFGITVSAGLLGIGAVLALGGAVLLLLRRQKRKRSGRQKAAAQSAAAAEPAASILSMKGRLDSDAIKLLLDEARDGASGDWSSLRQPLLDCRQQLTDMDEYQDRLHKLLKNNDAQALSNTEDIVDNVEQYMLRNVRKVCNYMQIYDSSDAGSRARVSDQLQECNQTNRTQLAQIQEFMSAIADFLNKQGEDSSSLEMLEIYKNTILDSIQEP